MFRTIACYLAVSGLMLVGCGDPDGWGPSGGSDMVDPSDVSSPDSDGTSGVDVTPQVRHYKWAVLLLSGTTVTLEGARSTVRTLEDYYLENSNGQEIFEGEVFELQVDNHDCTTHHDDVKDRALAEFAAQGHDESDYDLVSFVLGPSSSCTFQAIGGSGMPGRPAKYTWFKNSFGPQFAVHEVGHCIGLDHARSFRCGDEIYVAEAAGCGTDQYGHPFDPMSNKPISGHLSAPQKRWMGWLAGCQDVTAGSSGTFDLSPLEGTCGIRSLRIPIPGEDNFFYYVEYRENGSGMFGGAEGNDRVVIAVAHGSNKPKPTMLDFTPGTAEGANDIFDGWLTVGTHYSLPGEVEFEVISQDDDGAVVQVTMPELGPHACGDGSSPVVDGDGHVHGNVGAVCGDGMDYCPDNPNKLYPGVCGCDTAETDSNADGTPDCRDVCEHYDDSDGDGIADCHDACPFDGNKLVPGLCGCGVSDARSGAGVVDTDGDGTSDCYDGVPLEEHNVTSPPWSVGQGWSEGTPVYRLVAPYYSTEVVFTLSGDSGDAELYVRRGSAPTESEFDCASVRGGSDTETCTFDEGGTYYAVVTGYSGGSIEASDGWTLTGTFSGGVDDGRP